MTNLPEPEQLQHLAEEVTAIVAQRKFSAGMEMLQMRHEIGRAILESPLYHKHGKGQEQLILALAERVGLGERTLRYCIEFAQKYPLFATVAENADPQHKLPVWRDIVRGLPSGKREDIEEKAPKCRHCEIHCHE